MSTTNLQQRLNDLFGYIRQGKIIEAMNEFYDKDTVMQDNANPPTIGLGGEHRAGKAVLERRQGVERVQRDGFGCGRQCDVLRM